MFSQGVSGYTSMLIPTHTQLDCTLSGLEGGKDSALLLSMCSQLALVNRHRLVKNVKGMGSLEQSHRTPAESRTLRVSSAPGPALSLSVGNCVTKGEREGRGPPYLRWLNNTEEL